MLKHWYSTLRLRTKISAISLGIMVVSVAAVATTSLFQIRNQIAAEEFRAADSVALGIARAAELALTVGDEKELSRLTAGFLRGDDILFIAVYGDKRQPIATAVRDQQAWEEYRNAKVDPQSCILAERSVEASSANDEFTNEGTFDSPAPGTSKLSPRRSIGRVVVGLSTAPAIGAQQRENRITLVTTTVAAVAGAAVLFLTLGQWMERLRKLSDASRAISDGNFSGAIEDHHDDEIGRLGQSFDDMRLALRKRDQKLKLFTDTLQDKVNERTRDLEAARNAAEDASRAKSLFLANMSHELRTPLNGVIGMVNLLLSAEPNPQQRRYCDVAKASGQSLLELINDILDFSKIEAGKLDLDTADFNLHELLESVTQMLGDRAEKKQIELICSIGKDVPQNVSGDAGRLRQVILNLMSNAIKFTEEGEVVLSASLEKQTDCNAAVRFIIRDSGIGIPPDRLSRLFKSFSQVDTSTTRKFGGTGLGLAISQRIVSLMGGNIGVDSEQGKGSTFWFIVDFVKRPVAGEQQAAPSRPIPSINRTNPLRLDGVRILLAEDNEINQLVACELLEQAGCQCTVVGDGRLAVDAALSSEFDVILMDCQMPQLDGLEATRLIRKTELVSRKPRRRPIVALTANAIKGDREKCLAAGMDGYVTKPIDPLELFRTIRSFLPEGAAPAISTAAASGAAPPQPAPAGSEPAPVDLAALENRCMGNRKLAAKALGKFNESIVREMELLTASIRQKDNKAAAAAAHKIKGAAANISADRVRNIAAEIETLAISDSLALSQSCLDRLDQEMRDFRQYLSTALDHLGRTSETVEPRIPENTPGKA